MMTSMHNTTAALRGRASDNAATRFARLVTLGLAARRQRHHLARLDDAALKDIGISRFDARRESRRPAWDVPAYWLR